MSIPAPAARFGPDPSRNEWNMIPVGFPVWLWTEGPTTMQQSVIEQGITIELRARFTGSTFTMGDGTTIRCTTTTRYNDGVRPGTPSPTCGHRYQRVSGPGGHLIRATTHWEVTWSALGQQGTVPLERTGSSSAVVVGELVSVRVR